MSRRHKRKQQLRMQLEQQKPQQKETSMSNNTTQSTHEVRQLKQLAGVMSCVLTHKAVETTAKFTWSGPKLNAIWPEVLAFFRWTNDTMHSESQVRLFVNTRTKEWRAWAFPQKARTGMSANELKDTDEGYDKTKEQLVQFSDSEGWQYWGTAHHHCNMQAFQSGTDQENERRQDGLHITVGNMSSAEYDIHWRLYLGGIKLISVKLTEFWDVGDPFAGIPGYVKRMMPENALEEVAKQQMGQPPPKDLVIPQQWMDNVVDVTPKAVTVTPATWNEHNSYTPGGSFNAGQFVKPNYTKRSTPNLDYDLRRARHEILAYLRNPEVMLMQMNEVLTILHELERELSDDHLNLLDICMRNDVLPSNLIDFVIRIEQEIQQEELRRQQEGGKKGKATKQQVLGLPERSSDAWEHEGGTYMMGGY